MHEQAAGPSDHRPVVATILVILVLYTFAAILGKPQAAALAIAGEVDHLAADHPATSDLAPEHSAAENAAAEHDAIRPDSTDPVASKPTPPSLLMVTPFALLLGAIALFPLLPRVQHWWESNLHRFYVAAALALVTLLYYLAVHGHPVERHFLSHALAQPAESGWSLDVAWTVLQNAILQEYIPFIVLLFTLYTICGGIRIEGDLRAHPLTNTAFLTIGGLLASLIGTTGAAMLLIRPLLETNAERRHVRHTAIFFVFIVCNCGGCLLPLGDPPLFLGYLQGVDFLFTLSLWPQWLLVNGLLLGIYWAWDHFYAYPRESRADIAADERLIKALTFRGMALNAPLLLGVVLSVALLDSSKAVPGTAWHPWLYLREVLQLALVAVSLYFGSRETRERNHFNYAAITEVAVLFLGIFICMQPALQILEVNGPRLEIDTPSEFYWYTGALSAVLDNAPTYLVFFETAQSLHAVDAEVIAGVPVHILTAISLGAVFMGAMTYIGNGPNFMVKAIAESSGVKMPSFFGYLGYSCVILLPVLYLVSWLI